MSHCKYCHGTTRKTAGKIPHPDCPGCPSCADAQTQIEGLLAMVTERDQQIAALQAKLEATELERDSARDDATYLADANAKEQYRLREERATIQAKLEAALDSRGNWKVLFEKVHDERDTLKATLEAANGQADANFEELEEKEWELAKVLEDVKTLQAKLEEKNAEITRLQAALSNAEASYRENMMQWQSDRATADLCEAENSRLRDAAKGTGMVSELADMAEVAVLVVGLHREIARLRALVEVGREMAQTIHEYPVTSDLEVLAARWRELDTVERSA